MTEDLKTPDLSSLPLVMVRDNAAQVMEAFAGPNPHRMGGVSDE